MIQRRHLMGALAAAPWVGTLPARAQTYPERAVKIIVPLPPGSPPDVLARLVAEGLSRTWKQPVVVDNRPGATGMIGMQALARSAPDGYTMGVLFLTHTVLPELIGPLPYDTANDLAPVANLVWLYNVLVVPAASPVQSLKDLTDRARAQPGALTYASGGNGSPAHLVGESFGQASKTKMLHVPFKGPAEAVTALLGDQVSAMFATTSVAAPLVRAGKLRAIAVTSPQRLTALPGVPTLSESGLGDIELREWEGLVAPTGTPRAIIEQWNQALFQVLAAPELRAKLADLGMSVAAPNRPDEFSALIRQELAHWGRFVKASGLKPG
ncbi:Bug family tripartite tricarboxylate transporter substrate binding protein [Hydrogenophaga sp. OTU3427]|uniref:Bug family tripartite tricarboxylate transporter substrate binding protein n=1 Tax=Hydrogenophaga sp. OTU3427 TaxID=3043856 RepID=UPI00313D7EE1